MRFALYFGNRGFMPAELIEGARKDMVEAVTKAGYEYLIMDRDATRYGAVETRDEGRIYARWLMSHKGEYDGVILCQPIFIDRTERSRRCRMRGCRSSCRHIPMRSGRWILLTGETRSAENSR